MDGSGQYITHTEGEDETDVPAIAWYDRQYCGNASLRRICCWEIPLVPVALVASIFANMIMIIAFGATLR